MDEEGFKKDEGQKSKIKDSNWGVSIPRYQNSPGQKMIRASSNLEINESRKKSYLKGDNSVLLSSLGVTPSAQLGLERYQKVYLHKM